MRIIAGSARVDEGAVGDGDRAAIHGHAAANRILADSARVDEGAVGDGERAAIHDHAAARRILADSARVDEGAVGNGDRATIHEHAAASRGIADSAAISNRAAFYVEQTTSHTDPATAMCEPTHQSKPTHSETTKYLRKQTRVHSARHSAMAQCHTHQHDAREAASVDRRALAPQRDALRAPNNDTRAVQLDAPHHMQ